MATKDISDLQVVLAYYEAKQSPDPGVFPYHILMQRTGQPEKVCYRAMERADRRGLIDYGVSLRCGWPTQKGKELVVAELEQRGLMDSPEAAEFLAEEWKDVARPPAPAGLTLIPRPRL